MVHKIREAADFIKSKLDFSPERAVVLGTGLNSIAEMINDPIIIPYQDIPELPVSTAPSHAGRLVAGFLNDTPIIIMQGRLHYYEGYSMAEITFPIRLLKAIGIKELIITNAAGSLNASMVPGDIVLLEDHINFMGTNPLIGENLESLGERFPSMNEPYNLKMIAQAEDLAKEHNFKVQRGVYLAVTGPNFETKAECKMFAANGADLVGMSTVPEVIVAIHSGIKVLGISVVTNLSNIFHAEAHSQEEVRANAAKAKQHLEILITNVLSNRGAKND
ncbi:MAG: purine-nucleoside phosphorylase [Candidatus Cloacimonetes bacterium]|nr:purine-nucleoside phosphorylase [Candidatus Cloacimonadota bacterium]